MVYQLFAETKINIVNNFAKSEKIRFPAVLLVGPNNVGKRITAFHIIKKLFNEPSCFNIFYNQNFCYLAKNFPFDELNFLLNQFIQNEEIIINRLVAFEKLKFTILRFLVPFIHRVAEIDEKSIDTDFFEDASYIFYRLKNICLDDEKDLNLLLNFANRILKYKKAFKSEKIFLSEIKNLQRWIEDSYQLDNRIVLIDNIEYMQDESANAFLKTLEEPDENLLFILTSNSKSYLLPTILSRCAIFEIEKIKEDELKKILENEWKLNYSILSSQNIDSFYDLFTLLKSDINNFIKTIRGTFELFFLQTNKLHVLIENISSQKDLSFFLRQLILHGESVLSGYQHNNIIVSSEISYEKITRLLFYLNKVENFTKNYNYPIDNALIFSYLNRNSILNGDFVGEKIIL